MKQFKNPVYIAIVLAMTLTFVYSIGARAQHVVRNNTTFVQQRDSSSRFKKSEATLTKYIYQTTDGVKYPIYMSKTGKCFILRVSSKTGKQYRQYLPEVTKQLKNK